MEYLGSSDDSLSERREKLAAVGLLTLGGDGLEGGVGRMFGTATSQGLGRALLAPLELPGQAQDKEDDEEKALLQKPGS